jgi:hypothetical protein
VGLQIILRAFERNSSCVREPTQDLGNPLPQSPSSGGGCNESFGDGGGSGGYEEAMHMRHECAQ